MVSPWFPPLKGTLDTSHRIMLPSNMKPMDFFFQRFQVSNSEASGKFSPFAAAETLTSKSRPQKLECCRKLQLDCCTFVSVGVTPQEMPHNDKISDGNQWIYSWESKGTPIEPPPHDNGDYNRIYSLNAALFVGGVALPEYPHIDSHDLWLPHLETHPLVFEPSPMFHSSSMTMATEHISSEDVFWVSVSASNLQCAFRSKHKSGCVDGALFGRWDTTPHQLLFEFRWLLEFYMSSKAWFTYIHNYTYISYNYKPFVMWLVTDISLEGSWMLKGSSKCQRICSKSRLEKALAAWFISQ